MAVIFDNDLVLSCSFFNSSVMLSWSQVMMFCHNMLQSAVSSVSHKKARDLLLLLWRFRDFMQSKFSFCPIISSSLAHSDWIFMKNPSGQHCCSIVGLLTLIWIIKLSFLLDRLFLILSYKLFLVWFLLPLPLLLSDLQHPVMGTVPFSERPKSSGSTVQRGELCVSRQTGAGHRQPEPDALPEGRHQGDVTVSCQLFGLFL